MFSCAVFTCAMVFLQASRERADTLRQIRPQGGSDDITWIRAAEARPAVHIRGPVWTRGVSLHRTQARAVWMVPGPSGLGSTVGIGVNVDF